MKLKPIEARFVKPGFYLWLSCADGIRRWLKVVSVTTSGDRVEIRFPRIMGTASVCHSYSPKADQLVTWKGPKRHRLTDPRHAPRIDSAGSRR